MPWVDAIVVPSTTLFPPFRLSVQFFAMEIEFIGAAQTVTGSKHVVRTKHATVLLDCGLFQGKRRESIQKNKSIGIDPHSLSAVVLSHAHIDHSGALPVLAKAGYEGPVYCTPATRDLCAAMLADAAMIQQSDARFINKQIDRGLSQMDRVEPLYDSDDVTRVLGRMIGVPYQHRLTVAPGVDVTFLDAGHVLGSAITVLDVDEGGRSSRLVFTGDLGRKRMPILRDPEPPPPADVLIMESTYGDRSHPPFEEMDGELAELIARVSNRGGKIVVPSFALERAQEIVFALQSLRHRGKLPRIPVYVDSPLTVKITDVFKLHPECFDAETRALLAGGDSPFDFDELKYVSLPEDSKRIDADAHPAIIISASGMCESGRVLHHLRATLEDPKNAVLIVGFQAPDTLGRRLVEHRPRVRVFGVEREVRAEIVVMNGFSAHADQGDLLDYALSAQHDGRLKKVALVHGDPGPQRVLGNLLRERGIPNVAAPAPGERVAVD
jgi:metallo-beta-lactamase family protein